VSAETVGFPMAAQAAQLIRQSGRRKKERVGLISSLEPERLKAMDWLKLNRLGWGIESGLHQRLDVSKNDDLCRIRNTNGIWVFGMFRRLGVSLFMEWRAQQKHPQYKTLTDFHAELQEDNLKKAMSLATAKRPSLDGS
jgi:hypothetical protein